MKNLKFGLIGYPLKHSISKPLHTKLFELSNQNNCKYDIFEIPQDKFNNNIHIINNLYGCNITAPYKLIVKNYIKILDKTVIRYESINTIKSENGYNIKGYNTDIYGFIKTIEPIKNKLINNSILLVGYGGTGKMIYSYLKKFTNNITIAVRPNNISYIKNLLPGTNIISINNINKDYNTIINSTPIGMYKSINESPVKEDIIKNSKIIIDLIYNPIKTKFIKLAEKHKKVYYNGLTMLIYQAIKSHKIWLNSVFEEDKIKYLSKYLENILNEK